MRKESTNSSCICWQEQDEAEWCLQVLVPPPTATTGDALLGELTLLSSSGQFSLGKIVSKKNKTASAQTLIFPSFALR